MNLEFITQLGPPVLPVSLEKTEPLAVKNSFDEETVRDIKDIDIVYHPLCEVSIKSETVPTNILESKHSESMETQVFMKTENIPFVKIENVIKSENINETEDASDDNGQEVVEGQGNLETDKQQVLNFSNDLNDISVRSPKPKHPEKTDFAECYRSHKTTSSKIKVIEAPVIPVKSHEYITLDKNKHVCHHCQLTCKKLHVLKAHIRTKHREVTTMYQCLYCSFKSKWRPSVRLHIIQKHEDTRDNLKYYYCDKCDYYTHRPGHMKRHKLMHLKPEEIPYFYCYHCFYKSKQKAHLKNHVLRHLENQQNLKRYYCDKCNYKTYKYYNLKSHKIIHLKPEEIQYFYCYHCSYKCKHKSSIKTHILRHFQREEIIFDCYICDFMTLKRDMIIKHLKKHFKLHTKSDEAKRKYQHETHSKIRYHYCDKCDYKTDTSSHLKSHKIIHVKPEEIEYFYCYHCSFKSKHKNSLKTHIVRHFKNGEVEFDCYICKFKTPNRESIIEHIKKHPKVQIKSDQ